MEIVERFSAIIAIETHDSAQLPLKQVNSNNVTIDQKVSKPMIQHNYH